MLALVNDADNLICQLYHGMYAKLFRAAYMRLRDYHAAEDIVQDTFTAAQKRKEELLNHPNKEGWIFDVLKKKILHEFRARARFIALQGKLEMRMPSVSFEEIVENGMSSGKFDCLTEEEHKILKMIYGDGLSIRMVAEELGLSYQMCRRFAQLAKEKLKDCEY